MSNIERKEHFNQVCVWPGTLVEGKIAEFETFFVEHFKTRVQYLEEIKTAPDMKYGRHVSGTGGRNDVFFAVHSDDVGHFAVPRLSAGIRWIEDVLNNEDHHGAGSLYPERVKNYRTW